MTEKTTERITVEDCTDSLLFIEKTMDLTNELIKCLDVRIQIARTRKEPPNSHIFRTMLRLRVLLKKYKFQLSLFIW